LEEGFECHLSVIAEGDDEKEKTFFMFCSIAAAADIPAK
jgi:hypothetical protein